MRSMNASYPRKSRAPDKKFAVVSLSRKRASLLGKFPVSEPGRDSNEQN
jgi:hypothetical protein